MALEVPAIHEEHFAVPMDAAVLNILNALPGADATGLVFGHSEARWASLEKRRAPEITA